MPKHIISIAGGLNNALPPTEIGENEVSSLLNWDYSDVVEGRQRKGHAKFNATRYKSGANAFRMLGITSFAYGPTTFRDIFIGRASSEAVKLYRVDDGTATLVAWSAGITPTSVDNPFSFASMRNHLLIVNGSNPNASWDGDGSRDAQTLGIAAPTSAVAFASQVSGNLSGDYKWLQLYYDGTSDVYSAASPVQAAVTNAASAGKAITITITTSTNPRVTDRAIYRTLNTGAPPYYFVGLVGNNSATTYADNVADATLVASNELRAGGQPDNCRIAIEYGGVIYLMNNPSGENYARVYPSRPGRPEEFPASYQFDLGTGDGQQITGAWVVGNQLVVFKERSIWHITGNDFNNRNTQHMNDGVGMKWPYAGVLIGNEIVFASEEGIYTWDTSRARLIENEKGVFPMNGTWRDDVNNLHPYANIGEEVRLAWQPTRRAVYATYRQTANAGANTNTIAWYPKQRQRPWSLFDFGFDCHGYWRQNFVNEPTLVLGSRDANGWVFQADVGSLDRASSNNTLQGTASDGSSTTLTVGAAETLYTTGEGHIDAYVWVRDSDGTEQTAKIVSNTSTEITVASWPTFTPASTDAWAVASIEASFKTGRSDLGTTSTEKDVHQVRLRMEDAT